MRGPEDQNFISRDLGLNSEGMQEVRVSCHTRQWYFHVASVFPNIAPLSSGAALGSLAEVLECKRSGKNYFFKATCGIVASKREFGFKNRIFGGFFKAK
jgi:hypothetical protein